MQFIKKYISTIIMLISFMMAGALCGKFSVRIEDTGRSLMVLGGLFVSMYLLLLVHIILHEGGHLIAGLATGYEFVSFRIGSVAVVKGRDGKLHLRKMSLKGTGGQCLFAPPNLPIEQCPYKLYHLAGGLANIVFGLLGLILGMSVIQPESMLSFFFLEFGVIGLGLGLSNLIPSQAGGIPNDGMNLWELGQDMVARECVNLILETNARLSVAESFEDVPEELKNRLMKMDFTKMDLSCGVVANALNFQLAFWFVEGAHEKCNELEQLILETPDVPELFKNEARCEILYYEIIKDCNPERIEKIYDKKLQQYVKATSSYPSRQRLLYAYYLLYKKDEEKAQACYEKLKKLVDTHIIKAEAVMELLTVETIINK